MRLPDKDPNHEGFSIRVNILIHDDYWQVGVLHFKTGWWWSNGMHLDDDSVTEWNYLPEKGKGFRL